MPVPKSSMTGAGSDKPSLEALIPTLYLKGVSTNDFPEALAAILGEREQPTDDRPRLLGIALKVPQGTKKVAEDRLLFVERRRQGVLPFKLDANRPDDGR